MINISDITSKLEEIKEKLNRCYNESSDSFDICFDICEQIDYVINELEEIDNYIEEISYGEDY